MEGCTTLLLLELVLFGFGVVGTTVCDGGWDVFAGLVGVIVLGFCKEDLGLSRLDGSCVVVLVSPPSVGPPDAPLADRL